MDRDNDQMPDFFKKKSSERNGYRGKDRSFNKKEFSERNKFSENKGTADNSDEPKNENIIFGIHPVREALESGSKIEKIYIRRDSHSDKRRFERIKGTDFGADSETLLSIADYADARGIPVQNVPTEKLDRLTHRANHQGVVAVVAPIDYVELTNLIECLKGNDKPALLIVMDNVTDVRNFGAIARSAECAGADGIIMSAKNSAPVNGEAIRSSSGALTRIPVCRVGSLRNSLKTLQSNGIQLVAATEKSQTLIYESSLTGPIAIIMGSEDRGISVEVLKLCDQKLAIPILGNVESLNVSAAAAVMLYEAVRQRFEEM